MKLIEVFKVAPADSAIDLTLPLTFLDLFWFKLSPVERLFFYKIPGLDSTRFNDSVLNKLKNSLALTLGHYLPVAGNILWPHSSPKPILCYRPGDAVSLSVYESVSEFDRLSGDNVRETAESRPLAPSLLTSHAKASVIALSITLFPNSGFCIGVSAHHGALDGKSTTMFVKSWAHICREMVNGSVDLHFPLPPELSPVFDRTSIEENPKASGLAMAYIGRWPDIEGNPRSLEILKEQNVSSNNLVSATFELTPKNMEKLRNRVMKTEHSVSRPSTFVVVAAYAFVNNLRAKVMTSSPGEIGVENEESGAVIGFAADYRARLEPPVPASYVGNCASGNTIELEEREWMGPQGFERLAVRMSETIGKLEKGVPGETDEQRHRPKLHYGFIGVAGSARFGVYGADFGWGRPEKVAVQSIERSGSISMAESRDGSGGVEIGVVLTKRQMQRFQQLFSEGLVSP